MIDLCEFMDRDPEEVRSILDELLSQHEMQIALRPINYQEGFAS